jgi:Carboxypeptidase regulatory-like domain
MRIHHALLFTLLALCASQAAFAQVNINGSLRGRVSDGSGAPLPGATLTLINAATATTLTTTADSGVDYQFARIAPGVYRLAVEKYGFKKLQREGIRVNVNEAAVADLTLEIGAVTEIVTIQTNGEITQTQTSSVRQSQNASFQAASFWRPSRRKDVSPAVR